MTVGQETGHFSDDRRLDYASLRKSQVRSQLGKTWLGRSWSVLLRPNQFQVSVADTPAPYDIIRADDLCAKS